jgi:uncharacterized protein
LRSTEARALHRVGLMHLSGEGLPENFDKAETRLRQTARQNHLPAILALAEFYARGRGVAPNLSEAALWYRRAGELGDVSAQFITGRLCATGSGVPVNLREAARWFQRAAEKGHATAAHNTAIFHWTGTGLERDPARRSNGTRPLLPLASLPPRYSKGCTPPACRAIWRLRVVAQGNG